MSPDRWWIWDIARIHNQAAKNGIFLTPVLGWLTFGSLLHCNAGLLPVNYALQTDISDQEDPTIRMTDETHAGIAIVSAIRRIIQVIVVCWECMTEREKLAPWPCLDTGATSLRGIHERCGHLKWNCSRTRFKWTIILQVLKPFMNFSLDLRAHATVHKKYELAGSR